MKKRMQLLSNRLLKEAAERKLMTAEDTWRPAAPPVEGSSRKVSNKYKGVVSKVFSNAGSSAKVKTVGEEDDSKPITNNKPRPDRKSVV